MSKHKNRLPEKHNHKQHNELVVQEQFSGPLPPPSALARYNDVLPTAAERILTMAEEQAAHRRELERRVIESDIARSKWGQVLGFVIAVTGLVVSAVIAVYGNAVAGGIIGVGTLASLVGVFMYGARTRSQERLEKSHDEE